MLRTLLAGVLGLVLALPTTHLSAQTSPLPSAETASGRVHGAWDLPGEKEAGFARGLLFDLGGRRFALEAKLVPAEVRGGPPSGHLVGVLMPLAPTGVTTRPLAEVLGRYVAGPDGLGRFEATITPFSPRIQLNGRIQGVFSDPVVARENTVGRFVGRWVLR